MMIERLAKNLSGPEFLDRLRSDFTTYDRDWTKPGLHAMLAYRVGNIEAQSRIGRGIVRRLYAALHALVRNWYGLELHASTRLGSGVKFTQGGATVIHGNAVIGKGCVLRQRVTIGAVGNMQHWIAPVIGENVYIGAGAVVIGPVHIGDNAYIGPNAVVMADVAERATVIAQPPRVVRKA